MVAVPAVVFRDDDFMAIAESVIPCFWLFIVVSAPRQQYGGYHPQEGQTLAAY